MLRYRHAQPRSSLRIRCGAPTEKEDRIDYIFGADKNNIEPRIGIAYAPLWETRLSRQDRRRSGAALLFMPGFGIYDGRIFQSVFSQGGANVRFNPPNAMFSTLNSQLNVSDPTNGFVFTPGEQTARTTIDAAEPGPRSPIDDEVELVGRADHAVEFDAEGDLPGQPQRQATQIRARQPAAVAARRSGHRCEPSVQCAGAGPACPDMRGRVINAVAADFSVRRHRGCQASRPTPPVR